MELSLSDAADLLRVKPRTLRAQLARGKIIGIKRDGQWFIPRRNLPLTDDQRNVLQQRAEDVRCSVEDALPSRTARHAHDRRRSFVDLDAFRFAHALLGDVRNHADADPGGALRAGLEQAIEELCVGSCAFDIQTKLPALRAARARFARCFASVLLTAPLPLPEPHVSWIRRLEGDVLPAMGGLLRWAERLERGR